MIDYGNPDDDAVLYHYTSTDAVLGILKNGEIWASDARFSNDWSEFIHGLKILESLLEERTRKIKGPEDKEKHKLILEITRVCRQYEERTQSAYVFALTENRDDLSQWRGYTPKSGGLAIGVSEKGLEDVVVDLGLFACKCIYDHDLQRNTIQSHLDSILEKGPGFLGALHAACEDPSKVDDAVKALMDFDEGGYSNLLARGIIHQASTMEEEKRDDHLRKFIIVSLIENIAYYATGFKHHSFKEEQEVRIAYIPIDRSINTVKSDFDLGFRERSGMVVPYAKLPLFQDPYKSILTEIMIGPGTESSNQQLKKALSLLREQYGYNYEISESRIPYRAI